MICLNVPIARTGTQEYLASELGLEGVPADRMVEVNRAEAEVFSKLALSSFEGKPLTDDHPSGNVSPDNVCRLLKGVCKDVRRGQGEDSDKVVADLLVYDPPLISEIMSGKRGISCGYDCDYEFDEEGRIQQRNIRGNHVAVVTAGRAGNDVAIHDKAPDTAPTVPSTSIPTSKRRKPHMSKNSKPKNTGGILGMLFPMFAKDADPEAVAEVLEALGEALETPAVDNEQPTPDNTPAPDNAPPASNEPAEEKAPKWAQDMIDRLSALEAGMVKPEDNDPLAQLEKELSGGEESVTVEAEELGDSEAEGATDNEGAEDEAPLAEGEGTDPKGTVDRAAALSALRTMKPVIAGIKNPKQRKAVSDSVERLVRASLGTSVGSKSGTYSAIVDARNSTAAGRKAKDSAGSEKARRAEELGRNLAKKHNPHYKGKE